MVDEIRQLVEEKLLLKEQLEGCRMARRMAENWLEAYRRYVREIGSHDLDRIIALVNQVELEKQNEGTAQ